MTNQTKKQLKSFITHTEKRLRVLEERNDLTDGEYSELSLAVKDARKELENK